MMGEVDASDIAYAVPIARVPSLTWEELEDARQATYRTLHQYGQSIGLSGEGAKWFFRYCVGDELMDRTLRVELPDHRHLTPRFVEELQKSVLVPRPLWRILVVGESPETVVMIYPDCVRFGSVQPGDDWKKLLPQVAEKVTALREPREGPRRRQLNYLRAKIARELPELRKKPFQVLAWFDNWKGDQKENCIWIVCPGEAEWFDYSVEKPDDVAVGERIAVRDDGYFGDDYKPENPDYWLRQWVFPAGFSGKILLQKIRPGNLVEQERVINLKTVPIIRDVELKRAEQSPGH